MIHTISKNKCQEKYYNIVNYFKVLH